MYRELVEMKVDIEIIFISSDENKTSFEDHFSKMPWLALPFNDTRNESLVSHFKVCGIPKLVAIGESGETVMTEARDLIYYYGADAFPFTENRVKELDENLNKVARWPKKLKYKLHLAHELLLDHSQVYTCKKCNKTGCFWVFSCKECQYNIHPGCAL